MKLNFLDWIRRKIPYYSIWPIFILIKNTSLHLLFVCSVGFHAHGGSPGTIGGPGAQLVFPPNPGKSMVMQLDRDTVTMGCFLEPNSIIYGQCLQ